MIHFLQFLLTLTPQPAQNHSFILNSGKLIFYVELVIKALYSEELSNASWSHKNTTVFFWASLAHKAEKDVTTSMLKISKWAFTSLTIKLKS